MLGNSGPSARVSLLGMDHHRRTTAFLLALPAAAAMFVLARLVAADATVRPDVSTLAFAGAAWATLGVTLAATHARFARASACVAAIVVAWAPAFGRAAADLALRDTPDADAIWFTAARLGPVAAASVVVGLALAAIVARLELRRTLRVLAIASVAGAMALSVVVVVKHRASPSRVWHTDGVHAHTLRPGMAAAVLDRRLVYVDTHAAPMSRDGEGCRLEGLGAPIQLGGCPVLVAHEDVGRDRVIVTWGHHPEVPPSTTQWALVGFGREGVRFDVAPLHAPRLHVSAAMEVAAFFGEFVGLALLVAATRRRRPHHDAVAAAVTIVGVAPLGFGLLLA